ncbi:MAG TPA: NUDIX domain-containing protein [Acidimicrobiia bacterium]|jgi:ADP-ribose pyrophosphatase YjhB (NUDIX family)
MFQDDQGRVQRVGAYGVCVDHDGRMLLCRLTAVTSRPGWWTLPGGGVDFGEHPSDAVVREVREETGLDAVVEELLDVDSIARFMRIDAADEPVDYHAVRIIYRVSVTSGELVHEVSGTTDRAEWFDHEQLAALDLTEIAELGRALAFGGPRPEWGSSAD